ncbi:hypothetical protein E1287_29195 [Actinomadura sp. KC06]|uniref:hypothetical protein n=1 Tax=Actinomadura sp. KC06 TaxID=2530369 RepID=UPI00104D68F2|nr:hypothetical protein [Actinomadura sp. KC06]TDD30398.1 hypothetical protein E1287_29195 [Actinomadura sp. KC06]
MDRTPSHRHSAVRTTIRTVIRAADRLLRRGRLRKLRKRAILPLLAASALALTAAAVGLAAHPEAAAALSALTTVYIAVVSTQRMREERSNPRPPQSEARQDAAERRVAGDRETVRSVPCDGDTPTPGDRTLRGEPDLGTAPSLDPIERIRPDAEPRTERTRFREDTRFHDEPTPARRRRRARPAGEE